MQQSRITPEQYDEAKAICISYQAQCKEEYERTLSTSKRNHFYPKTRIVDIDSMYVSTRSFNAILALTNGGILDKYNFQDLTLANIASVGYTKLMAQKGVGSVLDLC